LAAVFAAVQAASSPVLAVETWEKLDKRLKQQVYQLNVALKLRLNGDQWTYWTDLSPKYHYPVFGTMTEGKLARIIGFGSAFPVKTLQRDKTFFITNKHVVDQGQEFTKECQRYYAAMRLYAEQSSDGNPEARFKQLLLIANLSMKKDMTAAERTLYQSTVDAIWDTYENYLSIRVDPGRLLFNKYSKLVPVEGTVGSFLHPPGPVSQQPLEAKLYKVAKTENDPDLAILTVGGAQITGLEFDTVPASEGQEIQVIGYPVVSDAIDVESSHYYAPTFGTGRISRVSPHLLEVDAPITSGNSGGPVVNLRGKVLGVVAVRAVSPHGTELVNFGGAVSTQSVLPFAPELFGRANNQ
jgi:hypothetical protein